MLCPLPDCLRGLAGWEGADPLAEAEAVTIVTNRAQTSTGTPASCNMISIYISSNTISIYLSTLTRVAAITGQIASCGGW